MSVQDVVILMGGLGGLLTVLGGAAKWILAYIDKKATEAEAANRESREALKAHLESQIAALSATVKLLTDRESIYLRRVWQLEAYIQSQPGHQLPVLDGWPPK